MRQNNKAPKISAPLARRPKKKLLHEVSRGVGGNHGTQVALIGAGGNGSQMLTNLVRIDLSLRAMNLGRLNVTVYDPDIVTLANVGRQLFYPSDIGQPKASVLVNRVNMAFGLTWTASHSKFVGGAIETSAGGGYRTVERYNVMITAVDTGAARKIICDAFTGPEGQRWAPNYWLDLGNEKQSGQVWIGEFPTYLNAGRRRLKHVVEYQPAFYDGTIEETDTPTCSLMEALGKQDLFICDHVSKWAAHLLWTLLSKGVIDVQGYAINLALGRVMEIPIWEENTAKARVNPRLTSQETGQRNVDLPANIDGGEHDDLDDEDDGLDEGLVYAEPGRAHG